MYFDPNDVSNCTLATCSVKDYGKIPYIPSLAGNVAYLVIFALLLIAQSIQGIRYKTWGFLVGMFCGLILELVGYAGRIMLHHDIFKKQDFILYLIGVTIGPAFMTAAIYLTLSRIITIFGVHLSLLKPRTITVVFCGFDIISLVLQALGGAVASGANTQSKNQHGVNIMIGGLASQVASLIIFMLVCGFFAWKVFRNQTKLNPDFVLLRSTWRFQGMLLAISTGTITILVRSIYRLAELRQGFHGKLAGNQTLFMLLEGPEIMIAVASLTVFHPGYVLGTKLWNEAGFHLRPRKEVQEIKQVDASSTEDFAMQQPEQAQLA